MILDRWNSRRRVGVSDHDMARAIFNGQVVAESDETVVVEGNHYFPASSLVSEYLRDSPRTSVCHWKGTARYYDVVVDGETADAAAWYYPDPSERAKQIEGRVAFWKGVRVET
jgi:uncharacterized protein (DUF427 family)